MDVADKSTNFFPQRRFVCSFKIKIGTNCEIETTDIYATFTLHFLAMNIININSERGVV